MLLRCSIPPARSPARSRRRGRHPGTLSTAGPHTSTKCAWVMVPAPIFCVSPGLMYSASLCRSRMTFHPTLLAIPIAAWIRVTSAADKAQPSVGATVSHRKDNRTRLSPAVATVPYHDCADGNQFVAVDCLALLYPAGGGNPDHTTSLHATRAGETVAQQGQRTLAEQGGGARAADRGEDSRLVDPLRHRDVGAVQDAQHGLSDRGLVRKGPPWVRGVDGSCVVSDMASPLDRDPAGLPQGQAGRAGATESSRWE